MPMLDLKLPRGAVAPDRLPVLLDGLTAALLRAREVPDTPTSRANVWSFVSEHEPAPGGTVVTATVVEGGVTPAAVLGFVEEATGLVLLATDRDPQDAAARTRVWVLVTDVPEGRWGAGGRITGREAAQAALLGESA